MGNNIIISKNGTIISPYKKGQVKLLEKDTSIYDPPTHRNVEITGFKNQKYGEKKCFITHHLSKDFLYKHFKDYKITKMNTNAVKQMSNPFKMNKDIVLTAIQGNLAVDILKSTRYYKEWLVNLQTGFGKTVLGVYLSSVFSEKTWITCFSTDILQQWVKTYEEKTDKDMSTILKISSSNTFKDIIENPEKYEKYDIIISTLGIITSYLGNTDYMHFNSILNALGIGFFIIDEAHRNMSNIVKINATSNISKTLYLTADFAQGDYEKEILYYKIFKRTYVLQPEIEIDARYTVALVLEYNSHPTEIEESSVFTNRGFSANFYSDYQFSKEYPQAIAKYVLDNIMALDPNHRILFLVTQIKDVEEMYNYISENYKTLKIGRFHSKVSAEEKYFTRNDANVIISTYKSFSTGMDLNDIKYIVGYNQSNKVEDNQSAGRARRLKDGSDAMYIMPVDYGFPYCRKKLRKRLRYLKDKKLKDLYRISMDDILDI